MIKNDEIDTCPFANLPDADQKGRWGEGITLAEMKTLHWVKPKLVVQIEFVQWTSRAHLRQASFHGIRRDKKPRDVVRSWRPEIFRRNETRLQTV